MIGLLGGKCVRCGATDPRVLQVNHLNGDPRKEKKATWTLYKKLLSGELDRSGYDLRCASCNVVYEYDRGRLVW